jgi:hypothetical protein
MKIRTVMRAIVLVLYWTAATAVLTEGQDVLYVAGGGELHTFRINATTGSLTPFSTTPLPLAW